MNEVLSLLSKLFDHSDDFVCMAAYGDAGTTYIGPKAAYSQGGYEVTRSRVSPQVEDVLIPAIRRLLLDD